jgi:hypothetical protein
VRWLFGLIHSIPYSVDKKSFKLKFVLLFTEIYTLLCLLAYSPNTSRVSLRLLHVGIDSVYRKQPYISRILHIRLNTFLVFYILRIRRKNVEYAERNFHFKKNPGDFKGTVFQAYRENTLNGIISPKIVYISFNNNTNFNIFQILSIYTI